MFGCVSNKKKKKILLNLKIFFLGTSFPISKNLNLSLEKKPLQIKAKTGKGLIKN